MDGGVIVMRCKGCKYFKRDGNEAYGDCSFMAVNLAIVDKNIITSATGLFAIEKGEKLLTKEDASKRLQWYSGGGYDTLYIGENFGCIHFKQKE
jgi:hypothetical protein